MCLSCVTTQSAYLAAWAVLGFGMRLCLYDAAFAALVHIVPSRGRLAISYLTLFGAFASTVFWVVGHYLNETGGWRYTLALFSLINLTVCLPLTWIALRRREQDAHATTSEAQRPAGEADAAIDGKRRVIAIVLFAVVMSLNGFVFSVIAVQLVPLLEGSGLATARCSVGRIAQRIRAIWRACDRDRGCAKPARDDSGARRDRRPADIACDPCPVRRRAPRRRLPSPC